jgi:RNA recognition motif-containing protein
MNTKIYVENLSATTTERELTDLFSVFGNVVAINVGIDRSNGASGRFAFVTMVTVEGALAAIQALNGKAVGGRALIVAEARSR